MPKSTGRYGPWGIWQSREQASFYDLVPLSVTVDAAAAAISAVTQIVNQGPMRTPGHHVRLAREIVGERSDGDPQYLEYTVRAGFVDTPQPFNHLLLQAEETSVPDEILQSVRSLVVAWQPDHLGVATRTVQRTQRHRPPEAVVGFLTYVRAGVPLDRSVLDDQIDVSEGDGGLYIRVPGTPGEPSLDHIREVRDALGYPRPGS